MPSVNGPQDRPSGASSAGCEQGWTVLRLLRADTSGVFRPICGPSGADNSGPFVGPPKVAGQMTRVDGKASVNCYFLFRLGRTPGCPISKWSTILPSRREANRRRSLLHLRPKGIAMDALSVIVTLDR